LGCRAARAYRLAAAVQNPVDHKYKKCAMVVFIFQNDRTWLTSLASLLPLGPLSPAARSLRLQRLFARLRDDASYRATA
jgi:hypothetical protein